MNENESQFYGKNTLLGLLLAGLVCFPLTISSDCGAGYVPFYGYSFINPEITKFDSELAPFFLNFSEIHKEFFKTQQEIYQLDNAKEWQERYCENANIADIRYIVYKASRFQLQDLLIAMESETGSASRRIGGALASNGWARYMVKNNCRETVDYLMFAKTCEPHAVAPADSWREINRDVVAMSRLIDEAHDRFLRTESDYIKLRYAFQAIRLAHYSKQYDKVLELVDYYLPKIDYDPSIVEYWIWGHKAGALQALGQRPEAAYLYSRIFEKCPGKRESAYRSFRIDTNEEWEQSLLLCKSDHERANLYVLRANSNNALLVEEMQNIYAYDPQHHALEMLLVRELQQLEKDLLAESINPYRANNVRQHGIPRVYAGERVIELQNQVRSWLKEGKLRQPALWKLAQGYLEVLAGNYYFAERTLEEADEMIEDKHLKEQLSVFRLVLEILSLDEVGDEEERYLASLGRQYKFYKNYPDFPRLINDKLRLLYREQGDDAKAYLMEYSLAQLKANPDLDIVDRLIALCRKEERTRFEKELVELQDGTTIENELLNIKSAHLLGQGFLESALKAMQEVTLAEQDNFGQFNPFVRRFKDCVNCLLPDTVTTYNRVELIELMLEMEFDARAAESADQAASIYFDLGEAFYNMSYFGQAWKATDLFRSSSSADRAYRNKGQENFSHIGLPLGNYENFNTDRALRYFDLARRTAKSKEIQVAAAYMAAKCERNDFYTQHERRTYDYFSIIETDYKDTQFYQRIISECRDFQAYLLK
ncbi:MAG: hypothetical protein ACRBG0_07605 [Lewinella sp.]|jgi:hypothetical protein|uniref:hypothetical protein n=1 Tax=Lewinella sp. TaxID=2004506 RepID=UPI003D6A05CD